MELRSPPPPPPPPTQASPLLVGLQALGLLLLCWLVFNSFKSASGGRGDNLADETDRLRGVASKLKAAGAMGEAASLYADYLSNPALDSSTRSRVAFSLGELYLEEGRYEKALRWFYEADSLGDQGIAESVNQKIVHSLERLGRVHAAEAALNARTGLGEGNEIQRSDQDPVVAQIGPRAIYRSEVQRSLDDLPPQVRQQLIGSGQQGQYLQKYVADELIWQKAQKLEIPKDPEVRKQHATLLKQLVVGKFIEKEVFQKIQADEADLKTYHSANRLQYDQRESAEASVIQLADEQTAKTIFAQLQTGKSFSSLAQKNSIHGPSKNQGGKLSGWVMRGDDFLSLRDQPAAILVSDALFALGKGERSPVVQAGGQFFIFQLHEKKEGKERPFEEVRSRVEQDYRRMKMEHSYRDMIAEQLQTADVKIFPERLEP